ncbi:MAG: protein-glutamate O-methyltransferase CheR [Rhodocyclaceae bacterium]|nr:protein-glutamate O-methyltransferase CheR [Rhodocyclaceae bacterium]MDZ4213384.1 protein-glutamate O-methyltransferase CheR [Rhodocyclaceae bacterium]
MLEHPSINDAEFAQFQRLIYQIAGISLADSKKVLLVGRLGKRLTALNLASFGAYYKYVVNGNDPHERQTMVDLLTTNETYFFREEAHFDFLRQVVIPQHPAGQSLDIWSGASSTGEEIYTLSMVLADELGADAQWSILGSDISTHVLGIAQRGQYWLDRTRGLPKEYLRKYCLKGVRAQEGSFIIDPSLRRHARFMQINLNTTLPEIGKFHVIFLRNVMIYFDNDTKRKVVARMVEKLRPGGYFIVGHSESLNGINETLKTVKPTIYRLPN